MKCIHCQSEKPLKPGKTDRLPMGWHRDPAGNPHCAKCWQARYLLRAITLPVSAPVGCSWDEFRAMLRDAWQRSTNLANWAVKRLLANDATRTADMGKLPPMPPLYLYGELPKEQRAGWSQSCASVLRSTEAKYRARRYELIWLGQVSLPNTKYPCPYPLHNASWKAERGDGGEPLISLTLPGNRVQLRLRFGQRGHRNRIPADFDRIASGEAIAGEAAVFRRLANGTHRNGDTDRDSGGQRAQYEIVVKLVAWFPRPAPRSAEGTLYVRTDSDSLLIALDAKDERLWVYNGDQVVRWTLDHARQLQRWADDQKAEQRPVASYQSRREASAEKYRHRLDQAVKDVAAMVCNFAVRRKLARIVYNDAEQSYCPRFPWAGLRSRVEVKCDELGLAFERSGGEKEPGAARSDVTRED